MQLKAQASMCGIDMLNSNKHSNQLIRICDSCDNSELVWTELYQIEHEIQQHVFLSVAALSIRRCHQTQFLKPISHVIERLFLQNGDKSQFQHFNSR
jgi:hypothetical protein